jgi:hypothetical protein
MERFNESNPDPNHNSDGITAAGSAVQARKDQDLRVPYYCEENVWRLAYRKVRDQPQDDFFVCFISNANKSVLMFHQLAADAADDRAVCWDYHVILICWSKQESQATVYDIDSRLPYPQPLLDYLQQSFPHCTSADSLASAYAPQFLLVPAPLYLKYFASDRMHMYDAHRHCWMAAPPAYDCITSSQSLNDRRGGEPDWITLQQYLEFPSNGDQSSETSPEKADLTLTKALGRILSLKELMKFDFERATPAVT